MIDKEEARARLITMAQNESLGLEREALIIGANALIDNENLWLEAHDKQIRAEVIEECIEKIVNTPTKIKIEHYKENDILVDRQHEIIDMLVELKEQNR